MKYFASNPPETDKMWCQEVSCVYDYLRDGVGIDIGAGSRTVDEHTTCVDTLRPPNGHERNRTCDAQTLEGIEGNSFDWAVLIHSLEHMRSPIAALRAAARVVRVGGHVVVICPNTDYTLTQNNDPTPHYYEWSPREFIAFLRGGELDRLTPWYDVRSEVSGAPLRICDSGIACPRWSFRVVFEVTGAVEEIGIDGTAA